MGPVRQQLQRQSEMWYPAARRLDAKTLLVPAVSWRGTLQWDALSYSFRRLAISVKVRNMQS